jgi:PAS domain S-box-containing protein
MNTHLRTSESLSLRKAAFEHARDVGSSAEPLTIAIAASLEARHTGFNEFKALLREILSRLGKCTAAELEQEVSAVFKRSCDFLGIERAELWCCLSWDAKAVTLAHWSPRPKNLRLHSQLGNVASSSAPTAPDSCPFPAEIGTDLQPRFPWINLQLEQGRTVVFASLSELPVEAEQDKKTLKERGLKSALVVPLQVDGVGVGALSFVITREQAKLRSVLVEKIELIAQVLGESIARRLREEDLRVGLTEASQFRSALDAHALVTITDAQGSISYANDNFCKVSKYSREEVLNQKDRILNSGHHPTQFFEEIWATIRRGEVWRGDIKERSKDGSFYWTAATVVPLGDDQGTPREYMWIRFDITKARVLEEELAKSCQELKQRLQAEKDYVKTELKVTQMHGEIIGRSQAIRRVLRQVEQVAPVDCTVLITGETGTGKELIARALHRLSARRERAMVMVNCAALPATLVESELFGRERGAYTGALTSELGRFEIADGSSIFLDEIGELSLETQAKLLRILQEGEFQRLGNPKTRKVNVRVIAATNKDLAKEVRVGRFREDLYYRLGVFPINVPPLRERMEDLPLLVSAFIEEFSGRMSKQITRIPRKMLEALERHPWPGNIRELRNIIERGVILSSGETLMVPNLDGFSETTAPPTSLAEAEREHILRTLQEASWRVKGPYGAAKRLEVNPSTLYSRMAKLNIHRPCSEGGMSSQSR